MNLLLKNTADLVKDAPFPWAVCGGFALELFLGKELRPHGDIDLCVFEKNRDNILSYMLQKGWDVYEFRGYGRLRPLDVSSQSETGRNLMCLGKGCDLVKFYPCEEKTLVYYKFFHTGIQRLNYLEFLFNHANDTHFIFDRERNLTRKLSKAILHRDGIPYLSPEIVLLYKASQAENADYQLDFEQAYPMLSDEQREWFLKGLRALYPDGHRWEIGI